MFHVICTRPNASHLINGVSFVDHPAGGVITDPPVDDDIASMFRDFEGYEVIDLDARKAPVVTADGASLGRGRPSKEVVDGWRAEIAALGGAVPEGVTGKAIADFLAELKAQKAAPTVDVEPEAEPVDEPVLAAEPASEAQAEAAEPAA